MTIRTTILAAVASLAFIGAAVADTQTYTAPGASLEAPASVITNGALRHSSNGRVMATYTEKDLTTGKVSRAVANFANESEAIGYAIAKNAAAGGYHPVNFTGIETKTTPRNLRAFNPKIASVVAVRSGGMLTRTVTRTDGTVVKRTQTNYGTAISVSRPANAGAQVSNANYGKAAGKF